MLQVNIESGAATAALQAAAASVTNLRPLYRILAGVLEAETESNFAAEGRPAWAPLAESTRESRLKRNRGGSVLKILQDRGILAASVSSEFGADFALIGAGGAASAYAALHQFGGTVTRQPYSTRVRLRTDRGGELLRQQAKGKGKNLAVFAKESGGKAHKQFRETWHEVKGFTVTLPARPYLPFSGPADSPVLQPSAEASILAAISAHISDTIG